MAIKKMHGHAVTSVVPSTSDAAAVSPANVQFPQAPTNQSGGTGGGATPTKQARGSLKPVIR